MDAATLRQHALALIEEDIEHLRGQVSRIQIELDAIAKISKNNMTLENVYRRQALNYFLDKNKEAETEINEFLKVQLDNLCESLLHVATQSHIGVFDSWLLPELKSRLAYNYRYRSHLTHNYDPDALPGINLRFLSLPSPTYCELIESIRVLYNDRHVSSEFDAFAEAYIELTTLQALRSALERDPIIGSKAEVVSHIIGRFEVRDYISLAHILPSFIEGVFHDICLTLGLKSTELDKGSFKVAVEKVGNFTGAIGIEYLLFVFPLRRNRVAHGRPLKASFREVAIDFLLDIELLLGAMQHRDLPLNALLAILRNPSPAEVRKLFDFSLRDLYTQVARECVALGPILESEKFWIELDQLLTQIDISDKLTERFAKNVLSQPQLFGEPPIAERISSRARTFLQTQLPAARERIRNKEMERNLMVAKFRHALGLDNDTRLAADGYQEGASD